MNNSQRYLFAIDFDGTVAATFEDSPNGMNVNVASSKAIKEIFGDEGAQVYTTLGGLKNREPGELIRLMKENIESSHQSLEELTELYIQKKLSYLVPEISQNWPRLYPGARDFFLNIHSGDFPIDIAILSSGHDLFIKKFFEVNEISPPSIIVTSDIIRSRKMPERERYKPFPYQLAEAHRQWEAHNPSTEKYIGRTHSKPNMIYIGDDPIKDAGLAEQARIPFLFVPFTNPGFVPKEENGQIVIQDFTQLWRIVTENINLLRQGESFSSILFHREDRKLFTPLPESERPYQRMLKRERSL